MHLETYLGPRQTGIKKVFLREIFKKHSFVSSLCIYIKSNFN